MAKYNTAALFCDRLNKYFPGAAVKVKDSLLMAVRAVGSEVAKRGCFSLCQLPVQTTVRDVKVKENNIIIKVFWHSPQALYYLLQTSAREYIHLL